MRFRVNLIVAGLLGLAFFAVTVLGAPRGAHFVPQEPSTSVFAAPAALTLEPNDPCFRHAQSSPCSNDQWNLRQIGLPAAWITTTGSADVIVAVIDTGVDANHPDLAGKLVAGWDFVYQTGDSSPHADEGPAAGYGTAVAGVVAATTDNGLGIAGVSWNAKIMPLKAFTRTNDAIPYLSSTRAITEALEFAIRNRANVILMPFALTGLSAEQRQALSQALARAHSAGAVLVAAVGEGTGGIPTWPAADLNVLGVTATELLPDGREVRLDSANVGNFVTIAAPGGIVPTTYWAADSGSTYFSGSGTDFAAAHVAGLAALIWSINPTLPPDQVRKYMLDSADKIGDEPYEPNQNPFYGFGRINARRALQMTPHFLSLSPNPAHLSFDLLNGVVTPITQTVINRWTSAVTWWVEPDPNLPWLQINGPSGLVPSVLTISVDPGRISATCGRISGSLTARSRLPDLPLSVRERPIWVDVNLAPCSTLTPSPTVLPTDTITPTLIPTDTPASPTPSSTPSPTGTSSPTPTETLSPTLPPQDTATPTLTPSPTWTPSPTPSVTPSPTQPSPGTATPTLTPSPTWTPSPTPTSTRAPEQSVYLPLVLRRSLTSALPSTHCTPAVACRWVR